MIRPMIGVAATLLASGTIMTAMPAQAQSRHYDSDRDGRSDAREWNRDRDRDGRPDQWDRSDRRRDWSDRSGRRWRYYGGNYGYDGYNGYYRIGQRYPYYRTRGYYLNNYRYYNLPAPRRGYRYYRDRNGDILMVAIASGLIGAIIGSAIDDDGYRRRRY